jgi:hypothetical protein
MNDDPFPQTLPQQLREVGKRGRVERLKQIYTTPIGRWMLCWIVLVFGMGFLNQVVSSRLDSSWGTSATSWLLSINRALDNVYNYAAEAGAVGLLVWFQCRWPNQQQWVLFGVMSVAYAAFINSLEYLPPYNEFLYVTHDFGEIVSGLAAYVLYLISMLLVVRICNIWVRLYLVRRQCVDASTPLTAQVPKQNSWSLQGLGLTVLLTATIIAFIKQLEIVEQIMSDTDTDAVFLIAVCVSSLVTVVMPIVIAYLVAMQRIQRKRILWWVALAFTIVIPRVLTELLSLTMAASPGMSVYRSPLWVDALGLLTFMLMIGAFFVACERSGYEVAMFVRRQGLIAHSDEALVPEASTFGSS